MKKHEKFPRRLLTVGFLAVLFLFGAMTLAMNGGTLAATASRAFTMSRADGNGAFTALSDSIDALETEYNMVFFSKSSYLVGNHLVKRILGSQFFPDSSDDMTMIRLSDDSISKLKFSMGVGGLKKPLGVFKKYLDEQGIPLIFVYVHTKILDPSSQVPFGSFDFSNQNADKFLAMLDSLGIDYIDTRKPLLDIGLPTEELYFRTDTHWTIPSAFAAYQAIAEKLNQAYGFSIDSRFTDEGNYTTTRFEDRFLGSYGIQTTPYYTGVENFDMITPDFETSLTEKTQRNDNNWEVREGSFEDAVLVMSQLEPDEGKTYSSHCYQTYNYNWGEVLYENHDPDACDKRLLIIKNSSGNPITDFLALGVKNVCGLDRRNLTRCTIADYIADYQPDAVVIVYSYDFLRADRLDFFTAPAAAENE